MIKMNRSELKSLVKECLVEILLEGLGGNSLSLPSSTSSSAPKAPQPSSVFTEKTRSSQTPTPARRPSNHLREAVKREAGGNRIMESILADTAAATLPRMLENDRPGSPVRSSGGLAEQVVASVDPEEIFGSDVSSKWATLAFAESPLKNKI